MTEKMVKETRRRVQVMMSMSCARNLALVGGWIGTRYKEDFFLLLYFDLIGTFIGSASTELELSPEGGGQVELR